MAQRVCDTIHFSFTLFDVLFKVWSMPGGFSSLGGQRSGYEPVDPESGAESNSRVPPPPAPKTTHTGSTAQDAPASGGQAAPGGYQTV